MKRSGFNYVLWEFQEIDIFQRATKRIRNAQYTFASRLSCGFETLGLRYMSDTVVACIEILYGSANDCIQQGMRKSHKIGRFNMVYKVHANPFDIYLVIQGKPYWSKTIVLGIISITWKKQKHF